jgi:acyl carrier protein
VKENGMSEREERAARVRELVGAMSPLGSRIAKSTDRVVDDLGYDSVAILELALALEVEFDLQAIDEEQAVDLVTVGDIEAMVGRLTEPAE